MVREKRTWRKYSQQPHFTLFLSSTACSLRRTFRRKLQSPALFQQNNAGLQFNINLSDLWLTQWGIITAVTHSHEATGAAGLSGSFSVAALASAMLMCVFAWLAVCMCVHSFQTCRAGWVKWLEQLHYVVYSQQQEAGRQN